MQADTSPSKLPGKLSDMMKKSDKQKLREFSITKPPLQQMLKELLQSENTREEKDLQKINPKPLRKQKEMATHSSNPAWRIPWMEKPDRLQSIGSQRVGHD